MATAPDRLYFVADFNIEPLARELANTTRPGLETAIAPAGPVMAALAAGPPAADWSAVVWTRPEAISEAFARARAFERVDHDQAIDDVKAYAAAIGRFAARARSVFVPAWVQPPFARGWQWREAARRNCRRSSIARAICRPPASICPPPCACLRR